MLMLMLLLLFWLKLMTLIKHWSERKEYNKELSIELEMPILL